ncbi:hypothetical protein LG277_09515 [Vreelandella aquamarina]|uniref:asparagine synthase-related protein n=1 Tax=Vreelandella aquamarina TaxID=77097 RepID=UPI00384C326E
MNHNFNSHLGARSYYTTSNSSAYCHTHIASAFPKNCTIDPAGALGVLMKNYTLSTRTLVQGVERTPWMARPDGLGRWQQIDLPRHGSFRLGPEAIATEMNKKLQAEALEFLKGKTKIGILLSGGMDSRIVAAVVRQLQESGVYTGDVVALTWGLEDTRDVHYAQRIAERFGWKFRHFPLNAEVLKKNILIAADRGAEYSPVHLHAMDSISNTHGLDGILAGSYGDSIGRGEYSGIQVNDLPHILEKHLNHFAFMLRSVEQTALETIRMDLANDRRIILDRSEIAYREIEMQMHYMRRQLNTCMEVIDDRIPVYQMFGAPEVFGYMWSLDPACRTNENYEHLLKILPGNLLEIPWARTGGRYNKSNEVPEDGFSKLNNRYGEWLRNDLREFVLDEINSGALSSLGIFNNKSLAMWSRHWSKSKRPKADRLDEKMAWLASLSLFVKKYNIQAIDTPANYSMVDRFAKTKAFLHTRLYQVAIGVLKR